HTSAMTFRRHGELAYRDPRSISTRRSADLGGTRVVSASRRRRNRVDGRRAQKIENFIPPSICTPRRQRRVHTQDIHYFAGYYIARSSNIPPIWTGKLLKSGVWSLEGHFVESVESYSRI